MLRLLCCAIALLVAGCNTLFGVEEGHAKPPSNAGGEAAVECKTNAECLESNGEASPAACVKGSCVPLITDDCPFLLPQTDRQWLANLKSTDPEPLVFGIFSYVPTGELVNVHSQNYDLSLTDVTQIIGGLPAAGGKTRKVVALVCRNVYDDPAGLDRAVDHLVTELSVPAIIAGLETNDFERAFARSTDHHVFFMNPYGAEANADLNGDGLIWSMLPAAKDLAPTYKPLLNQTIDHLRATGTLGADEKARVALVYDQDYRPPSDLAQAALDVIEFNGESARDNTKDGYFKLYSIQSQAFSSQPIDYSAAIYDLIDFAPHIVISLATKEFPSNFMFLLEGIQTPTYLLGPWNYHDDFVTYLATSSTSDLRTRIIGTNYAAAADPTVYDAYLAHYAAAFPDQAGTTGYENFYDAGYYLLYAGIAAGARSSLTGPDLTSGMRRLRGGDSTFAVGPEDLATASRALRTTPNPITLNGAMGPPDFDAVGVRTDPSTVWCLGPDLTTRADVLRLDNDGNLTGDFPCFDFP